MIIMALDHVRDFFHATAMTNDPTDMNTTSPALFFTRWITHFCAPVFLFLSGCSAYLNGLKKTRAELRQFLLKRGLWLIAVELVIVTLGITFDPLYHMFILQVIWATGISMVILSQLLRLPFKAILAIGLFIFLGHNLLDFAEAARKGQIGILWTFLHGQGSFISLGHSRAIFLVYSFVPWTGLMILGYCCGVFFGPDFNAARRRQVLMRLGVIMIVAFVVLRWLNVYGDRQHWSAQRNGLYTFLSFLNTNKYPPSLLYSCMTIGPALIVLALLERYNNRFTRFVSVYGKVPFFYYIIHFYLIHTLCMIAYFMQHLPLKDAFNTGTGFAFRPQHFGYVLPVVYLIWMAVVLVLYIPCKRYSNYKRHHHQWWLSYL